MRIYDLTRFVTSPLQQVPGHQIILLSNVKGVDTSRDLADLAGRYYSRFFLHRNGNTHRYAVACARERELFAISIFYFECGKKFSAVALYL